MQAQFFWFCFLVSFLYVPLFRLVEFLCESGAAKVKGEPWPL